MSRPMPEPKFIRSPGEGLFTLYYPCAKPKAAVLICYPAPQELMRSQSAHGQLAKKLQDAGFAVLRFDYSATGDSEGDRPSFERWLADALAAAAYLKTESGCTQLYVLGTRLGGTLALRLSQTLHIDRLILWDPVLDGQTLLKDYDAAHERLLLRVPDDPPYPSHQKDQEQSCGYAWPKSFQTELLALKGAALSTRCPRLHLVVEGHNAALRTQTEVWESEGLRVTLMETGEAMLWDCERHMLIRAFPAQSLKALIASVEVA